MEVCTFLLLDDTLNDMIHTVHQTKNIALQGTLCVNGSGIGLVVQTGDRTVLLV